MALSFGSSPPGKAMSSHQAFVRLWGSLALSYHRFCLISTKIFPITRYCLCAIATVHRCVSALQRKSFQFFLHFLFTFSFCATFIHFREFLVTVLSLPSSSAPFLQGKCMYSSIRLPLIHLAVLFAFFPALLCIFFRYTDFLFTRYTISLVQQNASVSDIIYKFSPFLGATFI